MERTGKAYRMIFWGMLLVSRSLFAQNELPETLSEPKLAGEKYVPESGYSGSQLYRDTWFQGDVFLESGRTAHEKTLAYNGVQDALVWLDTQGGKVVRLDKGLISGFVLRDDSGTEMYFRKIRVRPYFSRDTVPLFLQVLFRGQQLSLYVQRKIENYYNDNYGGSLEDAGRRTLELRPVYYLFFEGKEHLRMRKIRKKELLTAFLPEKQQIKKLLRKEHLPVRNEFQLIKALEIIDPLQLTGVKEK